MNKDQHEDLMRAVTFLKGSLRDRYITHNVRPENHAILQARLVEMMLDLDREFHSVNA